MEKAHHFVPSVEVDGVPVKWENGMIYWYLYGEKSFDIRQLRRLLGIPRERDMDTYWERGICEFLALCENIYEIERACEKLKISFAILIKRYEHENKSERERFRSMPDKGRYFLEGMSQEWGVESWESYKARN